MSIGYVLHHVEGHSESDWILIDLGTVCIHLFLTESQFEKLSKRFKKIVVFYDNDLPGIHNMNQIRKKFNIDCIFIPRSYGAKDISDFHAKYGREKTLNLIEEAWRTLKK